MAAASNGKRGTDVLVSIFVLAFTLLLLDCGGGSGATASQVIPRFAYVPDRDSNAVSAYTIDAQAGQLRANGYALAGAGAFSVAVDPSGKFTYVANIGDTKLSQCTIAGNGTQTP